MSLSGKGGTASLVILRYPLAGLGAANEVGKALVRL